MSANECRECRCHAAPPVCHSPLQTCNFSTGVKIVQYSYSSFFYPLELLVEALEMVYDNLLYTVLVKALQ